MIAIFLHHSHVASLVKLTGDSTEDFQTVRKQILGDEGGSITPYPAPLQMGPDAARKIFSLEDDEVIEIAESLAGRGDEWTVWCDEDGMPKALPNNQAVRSLTNGAAALVGNCVLVPAGAI